MASTSGYDVSTTAVYSQQGQLTPAQLQALQCSSCHLILREPMQVIACGHRFCTSCIQSIMNQGDGPYRCPVDNESFEKNEVRKDRGCQKEIQTLVVDCPTSPNPCSWRGPLTEMEVHQEQCPNLRVSCSLGCGVSLSKEKLKFHTATECSKRPTTCQHCRKAVAHDCLEDHYQSCEHAPITCDYCNQKLSSRKMMTKHLENECEEYQMTCPLKSQDGCDFQEKRPKMEEHLQKHSIEVAELLLKALHRIQKLEETVQHLTVSEQQNTAKFSEKIDDLTSKLEHVQRESKEKSKRINQLESSICSLQKVHKKLDPFTEGMRQPDLVESDCGGHIPAPMRDVPYSRPNSLVPETPRSAATSALKSLDIPALPSQYYSTEAEVSRVKQELNSHQTQLMKMSENLQSVQQSLTQYAMAIDEVRLRQDVLDVKTTNGVFVWKIPDIRRRFRDAMDGRTISLYSPPFYTSPHGYRMCVRAYLNGDGIGKGTHLSVFFVLMRSEHDSLLEWPFKQSVRFTLINLKHPAASITEAFMPDMHSPSFQKPTKDMNIASGFPKFARQSVLHNEDFTQGNTIYIKCQVDLTGLISQ